MNGLNANKKVFQPNFRKIGMTFAQCLFWSACILNGARSCLARSRKFDEKEQNV